MQYARNKAYPRQQAEQRPTLRHVHPYFLSSARFYLLNIQNSYAYLSRYCARSGPADSLGREQNGEPSYRQRRNEKQPCCQPKQCATTAFPLLL